MLTGTVRVLTVGNRHSATGGGYEAVWRALVEHLRDAGDEVDVLTSDEPGAAMPGVHRALPWYWADDAWRTPSRREARALERTALAVLRDRLARLRPDVVVWVSMGGLPLALVGSSGLPELALVHDGWPVYGADVDPRARSHGWHPESVLAWSCNSAFVRSRCAPALGPVARRRLRVDLPGVDPVRFAAVPAQEWSGRLAVVGRVEPRKGVADAVRAVAHDASWSLTITGPPERGHDTELRALATSLGVAQQVTLAGATDDVRGAYAAADVVVFPPVWEEPFGLVPLEAMSVGRPVVASGTGGSAEYLEHEVNCLLVPPGDADAIAAAVARLEADPALRARLVAGGRRTAAALTEHRWCAAVAAVIRSSR